MDAPQRDELAYDAVIGLGDRFRTDGHEHVWARRRAGWRGSRRLGFVVFLRCHVVVSVIIVATDKSATIPSSSSQHNPGTSTSTAAAAAGGCSGTFPLWGGNSRPAAWSLSACSSTSSFAACVWQARCSQAPLSIFSCFPSSAMAVPIHVVNVGLSTSFLNPAAGLPPSDGNTVRVGGRLTLCVGGYVEIIDTNTNSGERLESKN